MLAEAVLDWFPTLVQGGSFALVAYIVVVQQPKAAAALALAMIEAARLTREERDAVQSRFENTVGAMQKGFDDRTDRMIRAIETQTAQLNQSLKIDSQRVEQAVIAAMTAAYKSKAPT